MRSASRMSIPWPKLMAGAWPRAVPLIPNALAHIECLTNQIFISGDHAIVIGLVEEALTYDGQPLLYYSRQYGTFRPLEIAARA